MKKCFNNNKGFAITGIIYGLMVIFVFILSSFLAVVVGKNKRSEELLKSVYEDIEVEVINVYSHTTTEEQRFSDIDNEYKYITPKRAKYIFYDDDSNKCGEVYLPKNIEITINVDGKAVYNSDKVIGSCSYETITCIDVLDFSYTGKAQTYTLACPGKYKLEVWGAEGGNSGGKGGYSYGTLNLSKRTTIYVYTGGQGISGDTPSIKTGGFNGGGDSGYYYGSSGGGASDIRIGTDSLYARVIVAGGGGGGGYHTVSSRAGGAGGGTSGVDGVGYNSYGAKGGSSTSGGAGGDGCLSSYDIDFSGIDGYFGKGANAREFGNISYYRSGGGGGGWYGGGSGGYCSTSGHIDYGVSGGGGGSGYVYTFSTASSYPEGCLLTSDYYLTDAETIAGNRSFVDYDGTTVTGHSGNGYARITYLG